MEFINVNSQAIVIVHKSASPGNQAFLYRV